MKPTLKFITLIAITVIIANIGAWIEYPQFRYNPLLIIAIWKDLFPNIPTTVFSTSALSLILMVFGSKRIFQKVDNDIGNYRDDLNFFQKIFKSSDNYKYGYAKLIKTSRQLKSLIKSFELNYKKGIILGKMGHDFIRSQNPYSCLVLAPPGTGKTAGMVIPNLLLCSNSMIVHDPKGELYDLTSKVRKNRLKHNVLLFDPMDEGCLKFNVFAQDNLPKNPNDLRAYISNVANILFSSNGNNDNRYSSNDNYFENASKSTFIFFANWLIYKNGYSSIADIRSKLLENEDATDTIEAMIDDNNLPESLKEDGRGVLFASNSDNQWAGVIGHLKEILELFADNRIRAVTSENKCDFTGNSIRQEKTTIYLKVRDQDNQRLKPLISLILDVISTQLISKLPQENDKKITFVLDEFVRLGKLKFIADLPSISRGYNLNFIFVAQDYQQISNVFGQSYISIFESNCAYKVIFKQNNFQTAQSISKTIGNQTLDKVSVNKGISHQNNLKPSFNNSNSSKSQSFNKEGLALVSEQDILNLSKNQCLILIQGHAGKPILANSALWFKDNKLKKIIRNSDQK